MRLLLLLVVFVYTSAAGARHPWPEPVIDDPGTPERRELLVSHGIPPATEDLMIFLREGFPDAVLARGLPREPLLKCTLVDAAMRELAMTGATEATPLLVRIARQDPSPGVQRVIDMDFESVPVDAAEREKRLMRRALSLNAITALGFLGDESAAGAIVEVMQRETGTAFITKGATALALLGRRDGLDAVVRLASNPADPDSVPAFQTVYTVTGRNYGYTTNTSLARRRELIAQLRDWHQREGSTVEIFRMDVMRRLQNPPRPAPLDPGSLRALLRNSRDLSDFDARIAARTKLGQVAAERFDDLETIARDPMEDLDIRRAAMTWMSVADPRAARSTINRLRDDENPLIAELAVSLREDIRDMLDD